MILGRDILMEMGLDIIFTEIFIVDFEGQNIGFKSSVAD